jgi:hypothetical protein
VGRGEKRTTPVIRIRGDLPPGAKTAGMTTVVPAQWMLVYLDARTLWPHRLEWYGDDRKGVSRRILCVEFTPPSGEGRLTDAECTRMFSYRPEDDGR